MRVDRKGSVVRRIKHARTGRVGVLRLDGQAMMFFARIPDEPPTPANQATRQYFESKDGNEVERWINKIIAKAEKSEPLDWIGVVEVSFEQPEDRRSRREEQEGSRRVEVRIEVERYYLALTPDKKQWLKLEWDSLDPKSASCLAEEDRVASARKFRDGPKSEAWLQRSEWRRHEKVFALPYLDESTTYVRYTPELWAGLNEMIDTLERSGATIAEMLGTKKGLAVVTEVGAGLKRLGSGSIAPATEGT